MNDILFGNDNAKTIRNLSKKYFRKNRGRNLAAVLAIALTAFLFTSVISLAFHMVSSLQLSMYMQKGSKADGTLGYMTEEQYRQLAGSDFVEQAGHRRVLNFASNAVGHSVEIDYADSVQQELTFCVPSHGTAPWKANEITTTDLALKALGVEPAIGAPVPVEFEVRGQTYHYDMVLSGWWEANNDTVSLMIVSEQFVAENPGLFQNTWSADREMAGLTFSEVVLRDKVDIRGQLEAFARSVGGDPGNINADNFILVSENQMAQGMTTMDSILFAAASVMMFVVCGYLLIYNIFDISVMQDVRQYGLLRTIGASPRQIKKLVKRQAVWLTLIGLPIGLAGGFAAGCLALPVAMNLFSAEHRSAASAAQVSTSPLIFVIASLFTIVTVYISTRKPAKKAAKVSPLEAVRYTEQEACRKQSANRTQGAKLSRMAFSNFGRNRRRAALIMASMLLCLVLVNTVGIIVQSMDEEKFLSASSKTDYTVYNSALANVMKGVRHHADALPASAVDLISRQPGVENGRSLYRNTLDDDGVAVDYGFEDLVFEEGSWENEDGRSYRIYDRYLLFPAPDAENLHMPAGRGTCLIGNIYGASWQFIEDMTIFDGEKDTAVLRQKMATGDYVILGCDTDRATGKPAETPLTRQLGTGDRVSFYKNGELFRTCTILARANVVGTEREILTANTTEMNIGGDAPRLYMTEEMFGQLCDDPTLLSYGFDAAPGQEAQMDVFLNDLAEQDPSVAYTSTKLMKEQMASIRNVVLLVGGMIAAIMAFAGLINFTNMMVTSIITRRLEFATMQSIGMTGRQLRRLMVYEGLYYAAGADLIGGAAAAAFALTVLRNALNSPSMWFFSLRFTLMPALAVAAVYLLLASVIPVAALHYCNKGTVVERLRV